MTDEQQQQMMLTGPSGRGGGDMMSMQMPGFGRYPRLAPALTACLAFADGLHRQLLQLLQELPK